MGFADPARAEHLITEELRFEPDGADADVLAAIAAAADPDLALGALAALVQRSGDGPGEELRAALRNERGLRDRLTAVLGASAALGDQLHRHPDDWRVLRGPDGLRRPAAGEARAALLTAVGADPYDAEPVAASPGPSQGVRPFQGAGSSHGAGPSQAGSSQREGPSQGLGPAKRTSAAGGAPYVPAVPGARSVPVAPGSASATPAGRTHGFDPVSALRLVYRRRLMHLAARDLTGAAAFEDVTAELADLAAAALDGALAIARSQLRAGDRAGERASRPGSDHARGYPDGPVPFRLAVIGMGKCGAHELNYVSDVDVIFVAEPVQGLAGAAEGTAGPDERGALSAATKLASAMMRVCSQSAPEPPLWQVDANLRPEGRSGQLVRTLASHRAYYERWAKTWEFQALLKARPIAGDLELGARYVETMAPLVWQASQRENFVEDVQAMRRRVEDAIPREQAGRQLKLGPGGLRDIEFAVQLLQLVHGRADERLRDSATLPALAALSRGGYVGREDAADLAAAYQFLRQVEHLLQLKHLRRTHVVPAEKDTAARRSLGRALRAFELPNGDGQDTRPAQRGPRGRVHRAVAQAHPRGTPSAREAVLPPAAASRGAASRRRRHG